MSAVPEVALLARHISFGLYPAFGIEMLSGVTGLRLTGEMDLCAENRLRSAIAELPPRASEVHLQLAGLRFIDVGNTGQLVGLTLWSARPVLVLHYPPSMLTKMIAVLWPEAVGRYVLAGDRAVQSPRRKLVSGGPCRPWPGRASSFR